MIDMSPASAMRGRVRLRTLVTIRWVAVAGQLATILLVHYGLGIEVPLLPALLVVAASAQINIAVSILQPLGRRLTEAGAAAYLAYDILQLSALLYLTGGLHNPFAVLILAPVTVSATVLSRRSTVGLGLLAAICITILAVWHQPFPWPEEAFRLPDFYVMGIWQALIVGTVFIAAYVGSVSEEARAMQDALAATQTALAREQQLSAVGALAAAAAHELGSPLGTIAVVAKEMAREVPSDSPLYSDIHLLLEETARCREILAELGRTSDPEGGEPYARLTLSTMLALAAAPHDRGGATISYDLAADASEPDSPEPVLDRSPEFVHGIGTLVQNAIQFARQHVTITGRWTATEIAIEIRDDGPGFAPHLIDRLGEPYVSSRSRGADDSEHLGLGVFIAVTLLGRMKARVTFSNERTGGALVAIRWPREVPSPQSGEPAATEQKDG